DRRGRLGLRTGRSHRTFRPGGSTCSSWGWSEEVSGSDARPPAAVVGDLTHVPLRRLGSREESGDAIVSRLALGPGAFDEAQHRARGPGAALVVDEALPLVLVEGLRHRIRLGG